MKIEAANFFSERLAFVCLTPRLVHCPACYEHAEQHLSIIPYLCVADASQDDRRTKLAGEEGGVRREEREREQKIWKVKDMRMDGLREEMGGGGL